MIVTAVLRRASRSLGGITKRCRVVDCDPSLEGHPTTPTEGASLSGAGWLIVTQASERSSR